RQQLLVKEKALTRSRDAVAAERRRMPWLAVDRKYEFDGPKGKVSLLDLFEGRRQLIVYRAFFEPGVFGWPEHACRGCSLGADQVAQLAHLNARDTTLAYASRAPQADIARLKSRMGWEMPWYTMTDGFDADFGVDQWHGHNAFFRDGERVFRTYFINNRGDEAMGTIWSYLDLTPLGRQEIWEDSPEGYPQTPPYKWWNWHDNYDAEVARRRQELPWVRIDKEYRFETDEGSASLAGLFKGRSQLLVYHFMFGPDYTAGCPACSAIADGFNGFAVHLANHDVMLWAISRAPLAKLQAFKQRMGWTFPWASSFSGDFNWDFSMSLTEEQQREGGTEYNHRTQAPYTPP